MGDFIHATIGFIVQHAAWTFPIAFAVCFGESFAFVSLAVPGTAIMIAAGALVPDGTLSFWPLVTGAVCGAVLGDGISWWLGRRYGHHVEKIWPFSRYPDNLARAYALFNRFGAASVFVGRFFGPVRAVIPLVAGILRMKPLQFWLANIGSALIWAPALLLPGSAAIYISRLAGIGHPKKILIGAAAAVVVLAAAWLFQRYRRRAQR